MRIRLGDIKRLIAETAAELEAEYTEASGSWVWEAVLRYIRFHEDNDEKISPKRLGWWLEFHGVDHRTADYIASMFEDLTWEMLSEPGGYADDLVELCKDASDRHPQLFSYGLPVVGRNPDGSLKREKTPLTIDFDGTVTGDKHGEPIWVFDPETLELDHVLNMNDLLMGGIDSVPYARLKDIESGNI